MKRSRRRRPAYLLATASAALAVLAIGRLQPPALDDLRNFVFDSFQRLAPRPYDPGLPVRVVAVDEESLSAFGQWPWPRSRLAELVDKLAAAGAAAIAFDIVFAEADQTSLDHFVRQLPDGPAKAEIAAAVARAIPNDRLFAQSIAAAPVALGLTLSGAGSKRAPPQKAGVAIAGDDPASFLANFPGVVAPIGELAEAARGLGATNWAPDRDGVARRIPLLGVGPGGVTPSLALEALRVAQGASTIVIRSSNASGETAFGRQTGVNAVKVGAFEIAVGAGADIRPRYGAEAPERALSAAAALQGRAPREEIEGRILFIGTTAVGLGDIRATPLQPTIPGVEIHAQILESLLSGALLSRPDWASGLELVIAGAAFVIVAALLPLVAPLFSALGAIGSIVALFAVSFLAFDRSGLLVDAAFPSLSIALAYGVGAVALWRQDQAARRHVHMAFGKFIAPAVVEGLVEHPERLVLGGETRELTVLFSDLRDFSSISEGMSAQELTHFMNAYLTPMTDAILDRDGTVDKYIGDAIVAFWNAPLDIADHPRKAVRAALDMRAALARFNAERAANAAREGRAYGLAAMGIGLNLGPCSVGNMGSTRRFDYSILGDVVNLTSRLEGLCKWFRVDILASSALRDAAEEFAWLDLGEALVVGRSTPTRIFALAGDESFAASEAFAAWRDAHVTMMRYHDQLDFTRARAAAARLKTTVEPHWSGCYMAMEQRFAAFEAAPPSMAGGAPIWKMDSK
ncbi:adenylate/guanylate cyclase domain-containing protein [Methylosinus sp. H3A]|uniref:CHASE2 domain-containing protein n=1 Tax=Methylosinus sp. H3A TaxID=2785786 RepID=UPI0018C2B2BA|nr:adenylate/guanylate cyclase domain-containing protein [Methylosinus sp. H3A]MBG0808691.1 adenylate/guanylate cyclase domain-containing protein [Methylosinus sp. H3A]